MQLALNSASDHTLQTCTPHKLHFLQYQKVTWVAARLQHWVFCTQGFLRGKPVLVPSTKLWFGRACQVQGPLIRWDILSTTLSPAIKYLRMMHQQTLVASCTQRRQLGTKSSKSKKSATSSSCQRIVIHLPCPKPQNLPYKLGWDDLCRTLQVASVGGFHHCPGSKLLVLSKMDLPTLRQTHCRRLVGVEWCQSGWFWIILSHGQMNP